MTVERLVEWERVAEPLRTEGRFWSKVAIGERDECWPWLAGTFDNDYGGFSVGRETVRAHVYAHELYFGPIADGQIVRHSCDNKGCCNPWHTIAGTQLENVQDREYRGRTARGERSGRSKITAAQADAIRRDPRTQREIAAAYGLSSKSTVGYIKRGEHWRDN